MKKEFNICEFSAFINALSAKKSELLKDEIRRQTNILNGLEDAPKDKANALRLSCKLQRLAVLKAKVNKLYKVEEERFILSCNEFATAQVVALNKIVGAFAESKEDALPFVSWVVDNEKLNGAPVMDTEKRVQSFLCELYKDYIKAKSAKTRQDAEKAKAKDAAENALQLLLSGDAESLKALKEKLEAKLKEKEN